mmetsp:Transcript_9559/g.23536  ORF Transcript_9559/g.23536 Transcript_9559/m.23536 type:complete len:230 (-) Transcript_9559:144-833(-)
MPHAQGEAIAKADAKHIATPAARNLPSSMPTTVVNRPGSEQKMMVSLPRAALSNVTLESKSLDDPVTRDQLERLAKMARWEGSTFSCFMDANTCFLGTCCPCVMLCYLGLDAYDNGDSKSYFCIRDCCFSTLIGNWLCPYNMCLCPHCIFPCYLGHILGRFRHKYNLPRLPEGDIFKVNNACMFADEIQMITPCCCPCTLCLMYRTMKKFSNVSQFDETYRLTYVRKMQ